MNPTQPLVPTHHGTTVARNGAAVLLRGPSGAGKSDLALRLIMDRGFALVADDQTVLTLRDGRVIAMTPATLAGLLEVRGLGILPAPRTTGPTALALVVDLCPGGPLERLPDPRTVLLLGVPLPLARLDPWELAAAHKVDLALQVARGDSTRVQDDRRGTDRPALSSTSSRDAP
ncbi:MAG: HPr kinase/phosphatase C-terminal domain-containing protein [Rhodospirillum sp.]|nr:HPr kinase/phosphatase C-terminal domain-containing protein [Rhodospirillum sp.]MCF8491173.1 HPr kinase/phosphatase C-terminal domain-containing protein [Rhodospirillum sp.]MCF8502495.1 HPr kinase/phosphatase C-terminal domain-containing protein [Rhodospirillum sp.]